MAEGRAGWSSRRPSSRWCTCMSKKGEAVVPVAEEKVGMEGRAAWAAAE